MSITRLSGGLTPGDGSDPRTFPEIFNDVADTVESQGSAITGAESDIDDLEAKNIPAFGTATPSDGQVLTFDSALSQFVPEDAVAGAGFAFSAAVYYEANATWTKADYAGVKAIKVMVQAAGGGGGNHGGANDGASGAGGGGYAERFILETDLGATEAVVVGAGGAGGSSGGISSGSSGGNSSFAAGETYEVLASGGAGSLGNSNTSPGIGGGGTGELVVVGGDGVGGSFNVINTPGGKGGNGHLGQGGSGGEAFNGFVRPGSAGKNYGGGGGGSFNTGAGGAGADGIVIVEVYV